MASSITITALEDQPPSPAFQSRQGPENIKKKSMMSPRQTANPHGQGSPQVKRSTYFQYELPHNFPLSN